MRSPLIAGNWKMHTTRSEAVSLAVAVRDATQGLSGVAMVVCPPFPYLEVVGRALAGSGVALGAQNLYHEPSGAFTGEVSGPMLVDLGCRFVIIGHSERRHILGESDAFINRKVHAALAVGLRPILCVGEKLQERDAGQTESVLRAQLESGLEGISVQQLVHVVMAYEPVWAIGTGRTATPEQAEEAQAYLRNLVADRYNEAQAQQMLILYGGSVKPENATALLKQPDVDGALVGGASLSAESFVAIAKATS